MANDEKETREPNGYDEIDDEIDFDDVAEERSNKWKMLKKIMYVLLLIVLGLIFLWISFIAGQKIFSAYRTTIKASLQKDVAKNKETPNAVIVPKTDGPVEREAKSGVPESAPVKVVEPSPDRIEKNNTLMEKDFVQRTKIDVTPAPKAESSTAAAKKAEISVPDAKPAVIDSTVKPATKAPTPVAKKKAAVTKARKKHKEYKVVVGSFSIKANADSLVSQLIVNNYEPKIVWTKTPKGQFYRVIAGSYRSISEAKAHIGGLEKLGFEPFYILE